MLTVDAHPPPGWAEALAKGYPLADGWTSLAPLLGQASPYRARPPALWLPFPALSLETEI